MASQTSAKGLVRVFLCHAAADKKNVRALYDLLVSDGVSPWLDEQEILPGQDWEMEIDIALRSAHVVLVCLTSHSVAKEGYVQKEIRAAIQVAKEKPEGTIFLIPLRLEECLVPEQLRVWQWVDFHADGGYEKLIASCAFRAKQLGLRLQKKRRTSKPQGSLQIQLPKQAGPRTTAIYQLFLVDSVRFIAGPLAGLEGVLKGKRDGKPIRIVTSVSLLQRSVSVETDIDWIVPLVRR